MVPVGLVDMSGALIFELLNVPQNIQMDIDCNLGQDRSWYPSGPEKTITVD